MRCHVLADNKLALNAGWDEDLLADELGALLSADLDFDVSLTGFSIPEIDSVLQAVAPEEPGVNGGVKTSQVAAQKSATVDMACLSAV